ATSMRIRAASRDDRCATSSTVIASSVAETKYRSARGNSPLTVTTMGDPFRSALTRDQLPWSSPARGASALRGRAGTDRASIDTRDSVRLTVASLLEMCFLGL